MRGRLFFVVIAFAVALCLLTGCVSSVDVRVLMPATVDVSGYKTIAVRSTTDNAKWLIPSFWNSYIPVRAVDDRYRENLRIWSGLDFNTVSKVSQIASNTIYTSIDNGFFKVIRPELTDAYVLVGRNNGNVRQTLMASDIDAILSTEITSVYYDEYIYQEVQSYQQTDKETGLKFNPINFYLMQTYGVAIQYTLTDVENNVIISTGTFTADPKQERTLLGRTRNSNGDFEKSYYTIHNASWLIGKLVEELSGEMREELSPHYVSVNFSFMENKPKIKALKEAYKAVDRQEYRTALRLFSDEYQRSGHVPSGYNAAILEYAMGNRDKAYALTKELYNYYGSYDALELYYKMKKLEDSEKQATAQILSDQKSAVSQSSELIGF